MIFDCLGITFGALLFFSGVAYASKNYGWRGWSLSFLSMLGLLLSLASVVHLVIPTFFSGGAR